MLTKLLHENRGAVQRSGASREQAQSIQSLNPAMIHEHEFQEQARPRPSHSGRKGERQVAS